MTSKERKYPHYDQADCKTRSICFSKDFECEVWKKVISASYQKQQTYGRDHSLLRQNGGKIRLKKQSTKIDMTPMVDLAFLLLTFFILTTTFNKPQIMALTMPDRSGPTAPVNDENVLNVLLAEDNRIYWWMGLEPKAALTNYSNTGIRNLILQKKKERPQLMVLIKPKDTCKYENMVDILDEMTITATDRYAIVDVTDDDTSRLPE